MADDTPEDIRELMHQFELIERDARALTAGVSAAQGVWRPASDAWSIAECLDHLATSNRVYLDAMRPPADAAMAEGRVRRGSVRPGFFGGLFARTLEPPPRPLMKRKAPRTTRPRPSPPLDDALTQFLESHGAVMKFLAVYATIDLAGVRFPNPFVPGIRFSLATGLRVLAAHERRHLWQAWRVREAAERASSGSH